jgi:hypothetical protein
LEPERSESTAVAPYQFEEEEPGEESSVFAYCLWLLKRPPVSAAERQLAEYVCTMFETGDGSSVSFSPTGVQLEYAERLLEYFKVARVLAPRDKRLASMDQKLEAITPYITSRLYEEEEVPEPEDPELAYIGNFVVQQVKEPYLGPGHIDLEDPALVERIWAMVQTFRFYSVPREKS